MVSIPIQGSTQSGLGIERELSKEQDMFRGITSVNIDPKGRLAVPARYRDVIAAHSSHQLVVTIDTQSPCLLLYPTHEWEIIENKLQNLSSFNQVTRRIQRLLIGHATELELDNNGRILIPQLLRDYAGLAKETMLVGQGRKFELWDKQQWHQHREEWLEHEKNQEGEMPNELMELSL